MLPAFALGALVTASICAIFKGEKNERKKLRKKLRRAKKENSQLVDLVIELDKRN